MPPNKGRLNTPEVNEANKAKASLDLFVSRLTTICNQYTEVKVIPEHDVLEEAMMLTADIPTDKITMEKIEDSRIKHNQKVENGDIDTSSFFGMLELYLKKRNFSHNREKGFRVLIRMLARYQSFVKMTDLDRKDFTLDLHKIDRATIEDFFDFVRNEKSLSDEYPTIFKKLLSDYPPEITTIRKSPHLTDRGKNTITILMKKFKAFFNWCNEKELTDNMPFRGLEIGSEHYGTPYYLTLEERNTIADFDMSDNPSLAVQRDIFIFQCLIGCRVSDLLSLTKNSLIEGAIEYIPRKTKDKKPVKVRVPLNSRAMALVKKYKGVDPKGSLFPFISAQKYNDAIKKVLTVCEIKRMVTILNPTTGETEQRPINEIASSHMARRTFIGNLYRQVKDPNLIGALSGHVEGSKAFVRYRDIDEATKKETVSLID